MSRVKDLQKYIHQVLKESIDGQNKRANAVAHLHGVALAAVLLAKKRGEDPELAAMAGLLHDTKDFLYCCSIILAPSFRASIFRGISP